MAKMNQNNLQSQEDRNQIMEQGLHKLGQNLEQRKAKLEAKSGEQKEQMQMLGARLDQAESMMQEIGSKISFLERQKQMEAMFALEEETAKLNLQAFNQLDALKQSASGLSASMQSSGFDQQLATELQEGPATSLHAQLCDAMLEAVNGLERFAKLVQENADRATEQARTKEYKALKDEEENFKLHKQNLDDVHDFEYAHWKKVNPVAPRIMLVPSFAIDPNLPEAERIERLLANFHQMNDLAKEYKNIEEIMASIEMEQDHLDKRISDYSGKIDQAIAFFESLSNQPDEEAKSAELAAFVGPLQQSKACASFILGQVNQLQKMIDLVVEKKKNDVKTAKEIVYIMLTRTDELRREQEAKYYLLTSDDHMDPRKMSLRNGNRMGLSRDAFIRDLQNKGWEVMDGDDVDEFLDEWKDEEHKEHVRVVKKTIQKELRREAEVRLEWVEFSHDDIVTQEDYDKKKHIKVEADPIDLIKDVALEDRMNPFTALLENRIQADGIDQIINLITINDKKLATDGDDFNQEHTEEEKEYLEQVQEEVRRTAADIQKGFYDSLMEMQIDQIYVKPTIERKVEDYPCMKASKSLSAQICELHFTKKRWEADTDAYEKLLEAAEQYATMESNFRRDNYGSVPRSEIAQYAVEDAKQKLLEAAIKYVAAKQKKKESEIEALDQEQLLALMKPLKGVANRRMNAAINIINTLQFDPNTRIICDPRKAQTLLSTKFHECLIRGLNTYNTAHKQMDDVYKKGHYSDNISALEMALQTKGQNLKRKADIKAYMEETYKQIHELSTLYRPLTSEEWNKTLFCIAKVYVFQLMMNDPDKYQNIGTSEMEKQAKSLLAGSSNPQEKTHNAFFHFVAHSIHCKMDISDVCKLMEESPLLKTIELQPKEASHTERTAATMADANQLLTDPNS